VKIKYGDAWIVCSIHLDDSCLKHLTNVGSLGFTHKSSYACIYIHFLQKSNTKILCILLRGGRTHLTHLVRSRYCIGIIVIGFANVFNF